MNCIICEKNKALENCIACRSCKSDTSLVISFSNVKKIYKLTAEELNDADLPTITNGLRRKFLVSDINDLATKIYSELPDNNKRKMKYLATSANELRKKQIDEYIEKYDVDFIATVQNQIDTFMDTTYITLDEVIPQLENKYEEYKLKKDRQMRLVQNLDKYLKTYFDAKNIAKTLDLSPELTPYLKLSIFSDNNILIVIKKSQQYKSYIENSANETLGDIERSNIFDIIKILVKEYVLPIIAQIMRRSELEEKMKSKGLAIRSDSKMCRWYCDGGIELVKRNCHETANIENIDDIVDVMDEMNFLFSHTNYSNIVRNTRGGCRYRHRYNRYRDEYNGYGNSDSDSNPDDYRSSIYDKQKAQKIQALRDLSKTKSDLSKLPKNIAKLLEKMSK